MQYGNPVTFHQAIYRSYFVTRPEVPVEVLGRLLPDVDTPRAMAAPRRRRPSPAAARRRVLRRRRHAAAGSLRPGPGSPAGRRTGGAGRPSQEGAEETVFTHPDADQPGRRPQRLGADPGREIPAARVSLARRGSRIPWRRSA